MVRVWKFVVGDLFYVLGFKYLCIFVNFNNHSNFLGFLLGDKENRSYLAFKFQDPGIS